MRWCYANGRAQPPRCSRTIAPTDDAKQNHLRVILCLSAQRVPAQEQIDRLAIEAKKSIAHPTFKAKTAMLNLNMAVFAFLMSADVKRCFHSKNQTDWVTAALLHKSAVGQDMPNPKWIYAAATVWGVPSAVN